jgi:hypothetical protein
MMGIEELIGDTSKYFKFSFVRNPYTRAVSDWKWCKTWFKHKWIRNESKEIGFQTFSEYLRFMEYHICEVGDQNCWSHVKPSHFYLFKNGEKQVDFIGKQESFHKDFSVVCERIQLDYEIDEFKQTKNREDYMKYYTKEDIELINQIYSKDFEVFDYVKINENI